MNNQIRIKDVILNIVELKKQRDSLQNELIIVEAQIEQQSRFIEGAVLQEALTQPPVPDTKK